MFENDMSFPILIIGAIIFLIIIGRESFIKMIFNLVRGVFYLSLVAIAGYILKHYWREVLFHAQRMWADIHEILG
nr:hypothetical protein [candidate division Zixibacteria bacterium]